MPTFTTEDKDALIPFIEDICQFPDEKFVVNYRIEIEAGLLKKCPEMVEEIYKITTPKLNVNNNPWMLPDLTKKTLTKTLIGAYVSALSEIGDPNHI